MPACDSTGFRPNSVPVALSGKLERHYTGRTMLIPESDWLELQEAKRLLENPSLAIKLTSALGVPIEKGFQMLPEKWAEELHSLVKASLNRTLRIALATLGASPRKKSWDRLHKAAAVGAGGVGGVFGLAALAVELPISTAIMLRSVADIGRCEGENLRLPEAQLACLEVFALGGASARDDAAETGYYAVRSALAKSLSEAAEHIARRGISAEGAPAVVRFVARIAERFGVAVSEKAAAMAIPIAGALGGALINGIFMTHFQNMARGHFKIRRLERKWGREAVQEAYRLTRFEPSPAGLAETTEQPTAAPPLK